MPSISKLLKKNWSLVLILIVGFTPLLWFYPEHLITGTDVDFPLFPLERLIHRVQVWDGQILGGTDRSNNVASLPIVVSQAMFNFISRNTIVTEKIYMVFWFTMASLSMYYLMSIVFPKKKTFAMHLGAFSASILYVLSFYNAFLWVRLQLAIAAMILFPIYLALLIGTENNRISLKNAVLFMIISAIITGPCGIQPPLLYILFILVISWLCYTLYLNMNTPEGKENQKRTFFNWLWLGGGYLIGSAYWLIPLYSFIFESNYLSSDTGKEVYKVHDLISWVSKNTSFLNIFRSYGDIIWFDSWGNHPYWVDFEKHFNNSIFSFISLFFPFIIFIALFFKRSKYYNRFVLFFGLMMVSSIFLAKGGHSPFGVLYLWLIDHIPYFWIQRAPWQKFGLLINLCYSFLFGISIYFIVNFINIENSEKNYTILLFKISSNALKIAFFLIVITSIFFSNHLILRGKMFSFGNGERGYHEFYKLGFHHKIPQYLFEAKAFIDSKKEYFNILLLPDANANVYDWGFGGSGDISLTLFNKGLLFRQYGEGFAPPNSVDCNYNKLIEYFYSDGRKENLIPLLANMNIKYILQRNDFRYDFFKDFDSPLFIKRQLENYPELKLSKSFGKWDLYSLNYETYYPRVFVVNDQSKNNMKLDFRELKDIDIESIKQTSNTGTSEFKRLSATKYYIRLHDVSGRISLCLLDSYHNAWKIYQTKLKLSNPLDLKGYKTYINNESEQASNDMVSNYITKGWVTNTGDGLMYKSSVSTMEKWKVIEAHKEYGKIKYISKMKKSSIQNDNLPNKSRLETFWNKPLSSKVAKHGIVNEYANAWLIDINTLCENSDKCYKNDEGTYSAEFVLEFSPQRYFYLGLLISLFGLLSSIFIVIFCIVRKEKQKSKLRINLYNY